MIHACVVLICNLVFLIKETMVATEAMERGVMVATETIAATTGALVAAVATEVEDTRLVATEKTGRSL